MALSGLLCAYQPEDERITLSSRLLPAALGQAAVKTKTGEEQAAMTIPRMKTGAGRQKGSQECDRAPV